MTGIYYFPWLFGKTRVPDSYKKQVAEEQTLKYERLCGLEGTRFHDLRHTFASLMLMRGAKPKVISEALGHASVAFTMDTYSHIIEGMQEDAMALLDEVLPPRKNVVLRTTNGQHLAGVHDGMPA